MIQNYINHIVFVIDASTSMYALSNKVVNFFDTEVKNLASRSKELNQETRVSVYLFNNSVSCLIYDMDVMRLPSLNGYYKADGMTALIDGVETAINDSLKVPQLYGDHSYLFYVVTDGANNINNGKANQLNKQILGLAENFTLAIFVPNQTAVHEAKKFGFPAQNISVWDTTERGLSETGTVIRSATDTYMVNRSKGIRGTKALFNLDASVLNTRNVQNNLTELSSTAYKVFPIGKEMPIKDFVESWTKEPYRVGSAYYLISKPEKIQASKSIIVQNKLNGRLYSGNDARTLLGLPNYEVKVTPTDHGNYNIYIQSTSVNRKLVPGTNLIVMN